MALPVARGRQRIDREDLVARREQRRHDETAVDLDPDDYLIAFFDMASDELMELADAGHTVGDPTFTQHRALFVHHADVVMVLGPVHTDEDHPLILPVGI